MRVAAREATAKRGSLFNWSNLTSTIGRGQVKTAHVVAPPPGSSSSSSASTAISSSSSSSSSSHRRLLFNRAPKSDKLVILAGACVVGSFAWFYFEHVNAVFYTQRTRLMGMTWEDERAMFNSTASSEAAAVDDPLVDDVFSREVERIATRIILACEQDFIEVRGKLPWHVETRFSPVANAFNEPGGRLTVLTGLIDLCCEAELRGELQDARNGLACILAHELAHGYCRHGVEKLSWLPIQILYLFFSHDSPVLDYFFNYVVKLPHSRLCESEADLVGMELMARAGYDPSEGLKLWALLDAEASNRVLEFLSTHPSGGTRARDWERGLERAMEVYSHNRDRKLVLRGASDSPPAIGTSTLSGKFSAVWDKYTAKQVNGRTSLAVLWARKSGYQLKEASTTAAAAAAAVPSSKQIDVMEAATASSPPFAAAWLAWMRGTPPVPATKSSDGAPNDDDDDEQHESIA